jgi:hypothetical protein
VKERDYMGDMDETGDNIKIDLKRHEVWIWSESLSIRSSGGQLWTR